MPRFEIGQDLAFTLVMCTAFLSFAIQAPSCEPSRYVDCRKVCAPALVAVQDGQNGHCECVVTDE